VEAEKLSTQPPARFTESTLVKELEKKGIGRPSTYAVIIETLLERNYVSHANSSLKATELGEEINKMLCANFPEVMDIKFTALMEEELDKIEDGEGNAGELLRNFYSLFQKRLEDAQEGMQFQRVKHPPTSIRCEKCGAEMIIKWGKKGRFLACPNFPNCRNTKEYIDMGEGKVKVAEEIETDLTCEKCGRNMVVKVSKKGRFLACPGFPKCHNSKPLYFGVQCPHCENPIIERRSRKGRPFFICTKYPKCNLLSWDPPIPKSCPRCHCNFTLLVEEIDRRVLKCYNVYCDFKEYLD
jgi:DNA topoisomerase-1